MGEKSLVVVTGASGFLGSEQVTQLLEAGYRVRGTVRAGKEQTFLDNYSQYGGQVEVVTINNVATDDLVSAFKDADAIFHGASPQGGPIAQNVLNEHRNGTLNALRAAVKANVKRFILTSSFVAHEAPDSERIWTDYTFTASDWNNVTAEEVVKPGVHSFHVYSGSKALTEKAAWEFVEQHPEIDLTTISPPWLIGKVPKSLNPTSPAMLSTNKLVYQLIVGEVGRPLPNQIIPLYADLQDTVLAHVRALEAPKSAAKKRVLIGTGAFTFKQAVEHIAAMRPELKPRLPDVTTEKPLPNGGKNIARLDSSLARELLGITAFKDWKETLINAVDSLVEKEKVWKK